MEATLATIDALIHDEWFDLDALVHDRDRSEVRLTIYPGRTSGRRLGTTRPPLDDQPPTPIGALVIGEVDRVEVVDGAEIGWYDIGGLVFNPTTRELVLRSNMPLEITMHVRTLDVRFFQP